MLFNSYIFIFIFLPITLIGFFTCNQLKLIKLARIWIVLASLIFYAYWHPAYLPLLLISIIFNHQMGKAIALAQPHSKTAQNLLWIGITINLLMIGYYKYAHFFINTINQALPTPIFIPEIILPLAISFYTFTQIAYLVDAYRQETKHLNYDWLTYSFFIIFFPQLIAGPIVRHNQLIPQFLLIKNYLFSPANFTQGLIIFTLGLSKKVLIADRLSPWVQPIFDNPKDITFIEAWVGALSYTYQLYFDFSGYSDMAIGLGLMFNIILPINFDSPYQANSIRDFWQRWHITLSHFLRDYLYIPLGGNRLGETRRYGNIMITMLLGGLWHGAGWNYLIWGGMHGLYLCINHHWRNLKIPLPPLIGWLMTFFAVMVGWVIFRAPNLQDGLTILYTMIGLRGIIIPGETTETLVIVSPFSFQIQSWQSLPYLPEFWESKALPLLILLCLTLAVKFLPNTQTMLSKFQPSFWWASSVGVLGGFCLLSLNHVSEFLYFQF